MFWIEFFLYEILGRIVAAYLCFDCYRELKHGILEGKIRYFNPSIFLVVTGRRMFAVRDTEPWLYRMEMGNRVFILLACLFVAVFGWWHPGATGMQMLIQAGITIVILYMAVSEWLHPEKES